MNRKPLVFLSSTISDLKDARSELRQLLTDRLCFDVFASEHEGSSWDSSFDFCRKNIEVSDFMILILGERYGFVPKQKHNVFDGRISVTHAEFRLARKLHKPILAYIREGLQPEKAQLAFIREVEEFYTGHFRRSFEDIGGLIRCAEEDIPNLIGALIRHEYRVPDVRLPRVVLCESSAQVYEFGARTLKAVLKNKDAPSFLVSGGSTSKAIFDRFFDQYEPGLVQKGIFFTNFEYLGVPKGHALGRERYFFDIFVRHVERAERKSFKPVNIFHFIPGTLEGGTLGDLSKNWDAQLKHYKPVVGLITISPRGEFCGICPDLHTASEVENMFTTALPVSEETARYLQPDPGIRFVVTVGAGNLIINVKTLVVSLTGIRKAGVLRNLLQGGQSPQTSYLALRKHPSLILVVDDDAAPALRRWYPSNLLIEYAHADPGSLML